MTNSEKAIKIAASMVMRLRLTLAALEVGGGLIEDDHTGGRTIDASKDDVIIVEWNGQLCPFRFGVGGCCLNPIYLDEVTGQPRMSRWSIGPYFTDDQIRTTQTVKIHKLDIVV